MLKFILKMQEINFGSIAERTPTSFLAEACSFCLGDWNFDQTG